MNSNKFSNAISDYYEEDIKLELLIEELILEITDKTSKQDTFEAIKIKILDLIQSPINAIISDCDGTLVDTEKLNSITFQEVLKIDKSQTSIQEIQNAYNELLKTLMQFEDSKFDFEILSQEIDPNKQILFIATQVAILIKGLTFKDAFDSIINKYIPNKFEDLNSFRRSFRQNNLELKLKLGITPTKGTQEFLKQNRLPLTVVSNSPLHILKENTSGLQISQNQLRSSHDSYEKRGKPFANVYFESMLDLEQNPENIVIIEDSKPGVIGAINANICKIVYDQIRKTITEKLMQIQSSPMYFSYSENQNLDYLIEQILEIIKEETLSPSNQDHIIYSIYKNLFRPIFLTDFDPIKASINESISLISESNFFARISQRISEITSTTSPINALIIKHLTLNLEEEIKTDLIENKKTNSQRKIKIIVFKNGENEEICNHPYLLSIDDMSTLQKIINLSNQNL